MERWPLPDGWEWKSFPELCSLNPKRPRLQRDGNALTSFVPMQAIDEVEGKIIDRETRRYEEIKHGYTYFEENDVLLAKITPSMENGKAAIAHDLIDGYGFGTTEFHVFRPTSSILPTWIFYYIRRESFRSEAKSHFRGAVGQQRVPDDFLKSYEIPIPFPNDSARSLESQRRIILRLESLLEEVKSARQLQEKIDLDISSLRTAFLNEIFPEFGSTLINGWKWTSLETIVSDAPRRNPALTGPEQRFRYVDISAIDNEKNVIKINEVKDILGKEAPSRARKVINSGDIIFATTRHYLRNIALVPEELNDSICSTGFCVLKPNTTVTIPEYIYFACLSDSTMEQLNPKQRGANYPAIADGDVYSAMVPIPYPENKARSLDAQKQIVEKLKFEFTETNSLSESKSENAGSIAQLEQSFLAQAFRGEL